MRIYILVLIILQVNSQDLITCETANCSALQQCCIMSFTGGNATCTDEVLQCTFAPVQDFTILWQIVIIVVGFAIGIPFSIYLINLLCCTQFLYGMSVSEILAQKICCMFCLSPQQFLKQVQKTIKINEDEDEEEGESFK